MQNAPTSPNIRARDAAAQLKCWSGPVAPQPLDGGLTNTNFIVRDGTETYVVRIGDDIPLHGIVRSFEVAACRAAHASGLSPEIVHHEPGALVMRYVDARTLTEADIREPATLLRVVDLVRRCHSSMQDHLPGASAMFWVFQVCRNYLSIAERGSGRRAAILPHLAKANAVLEQAVGPIQPSFCHNDLLAANLLDDGERLWLLDWEYAGWNTPLFDLANLASNCELDSAGERLLLEAYFGHPPDARQDAAFSAFKCASLLRESLWSLVQEDHSLLEVSYEDYTDKHLARFDDCYLSLAVRS